MLSCFHPIPERKRTDRRTDLLYQYRTSVYWCTIKISTTWNYLHRTLIEANTLPLSQIANQNNIFVKWNTVCWTGIIVCAERLLVCASVSLELKALYKSVIIIIIIIVRISCFTEFLFYQSCGTGFWSCSLWVLPTFS